MSVPGVTFDDRVWLDRAVLDFIVRNMRNVVGVAEVNVIETFAPTQSNFRRAELCSIRHSFGARKRRVQKAMVEASIRRLIAGGRIAAFNPQRMRINTKWGSYRMFKPISILDALSEI
jgi:hypothetical protein